MTCFALPSWRRGAIERELRVFVRTTKAIRKYRTLTVAVTQVIEPLLMRGNITQDLSSGSAAREAGGTPGSGSRCTSGDLRRTVSLWGLSDGSRYLST